MKQLLFYLAAWFTLSGCEKAISFTPKNTDQAIVVEASIENAKSPVVTLSSSLNFFSKISPELLANSFIHDAEIVISTGSKSQKLKEYSYPAFNNKIYYYSVDSASTTAFNGELNTAYSIEIRVGGKVYTA